MQLTCQDYCPRRVWPQREPEMVIHGGGSTAHGDRRNGAQGSAFLLSNVRGPEIELHSAHFLPTSCETDCNGVTGMGDFEQSRSSLVVVLCKVSQYCVVLKLVGLTATKMHPRASSTDTEPSRRTPAGLRKAL